MISPMVEHSTDLKITLKLALTFLFLAFTVYLLSLLSGCQSQDVLVVPYTVPCLPLPLPLSCWGPHSAWVTIEMADYLSFSVSNLFILLKTTSKLVFLKCSIDSPGKAFQSTLIAHQINSGLSGLMFKALALVLSQHYGFVDELPSVSPKPFLTLLLLHLELWSFSTCRNNSPHPNSIFLINIVQGWFKFDFLQ